MKKSVSSAAIVFCAAFYSLVLPFAQAGAVGPGKTLTWEGGGGGRVVFEGKEHAKEGYGCKDCHPGLFSMKKGTAVITMAAMDRGEFCGACHNGKTAFATSNPKKCHECHKKHDEKHDKHKEHKDHEEHEDHHGDEH